MTQGSSESEADAVSHLRFLMLNFWDVWQRWPRDEQRPAVRQCFESLDGVYLHIDLFLQHRTAVPIPYPVQGHRQEDVYQDEYEYRQEGVEQT